MKIYGTEIHIENGTVMWGIFEGKRVYPYRWNRKTRVWDNASGWYSKDYLRRLINDGKAMFN